MIGSLNCSISGVQLQQLSDELCILIRANAPIKFEKIVIVMIQVYYFMVFNN